METEKKPDETTTDDTSTTVDEQQEKALNWLLEQDMSDPAEKLFSVEQEDKGLAELTEAEAAMASRPLIRGGNDNAVLESIVEEEIVVSSVGEGNDIYRNESRPVERQQAPQQVMYVDHRGQRSRNPESSSTLSAGRDILGLEDQDDMGERFLVIKKASARPNPSEAQAESATPDEPTSTAAATIAAEATEELPAAPEYTGDDSDDVELDLVLDTEGQADLDSPLESDIAAYAAAEDTADELPELELDALDTAIEYHQDFAQPLEQASSIVAVVTPLLSGLMQELQQKVNAVLLKHGLAADTVTLDCSLATDEATSVELRDQGYIAFTEFGAELPAELKSLGPQEIDAIHLRVLSDSGETSWNRVLAEDFVPPSSVEQTADDAGMPADLPAIDFYQLNSANDAVSDEHGSEVESAALDADEVFSSLEQRLLSTPPESDANPISTDDEDQSLLGDLDDDFTGDLEAAFAASPEPVGDSAEIAEDFVFDDAAWDLSEEISPELPAIVEQAVSPIDELAAADLAVEETAEAAQLDSFEAVAEPIAEPIEEVEDIFGDDIDDANFGALTAGSDSDVDAMLESFGETDFSGDTDIPAPGIEPVKEAVVPAPPVTQVTSPAPVAETQTLSAGEHREPAIEEAAAVVAGSGVASVSCIPAGIEFSYSSQSGAELFADFLDAFLEEGALEIEKLEDAISEWEQDIASDTAYAPVPRILHTLKGIAKGVGLQRYGTLIHNFETLLDKLERPALDSAAGDYFRIVNAWLDAAVRGFESIQDSRADVDSELPVVEAVLAAKVDTPVSATAAENLKVDAPAEPKPTAEARKETRARDKQLADEGAKALAAQQTIRLSAEAVDNLMNLTNQAQQLGVRSSQGTVRSKLALAELQGRLSSVRSQITRVADRALMSVTARGTRSDLDALEMDQYSELQEAASILREGIEDLSELIQLTSRQNATVEALLKQQNSAMSSLRSAIQAARVIPVSRLMPGLRRIVRTVGTDLGKDVSFRVLNETGKLDRDNYNRCQVILEHMVRNALDHGIEDPASREAMGKNRTGRITIDISKRGGDYLMRLSDDGRGMDPAIIREAAYRKGLDADLDLDQMSDDEVLRLIFHKGFSTAARLSEVSGRGVGMDIVLSELQHIGGDIEIESTVGEGTTFSIRVPSNITANGALLVAAGDHSYAIPLDGLVAVEHVPADLFFNAIENNESLELFGMRCEPAYLASICHGESMPERKAWGATIPVIVAGRDERCMAIAVDNVEQALELVIRTLGNQFARVPGLAGGATTADGRAIVALDLNALVENLAADGTKRVAMAEERQERMLVMVVDDSRTQRMVATSKFDSLGVETITAENGLAALELLASSVRLPDVILLDVEMPVKDGIQTLKELRKTPRYADIPVIMVTSRTGAKHRKLAAEAGCNGYMGKPFNFPLLVQDINKLTGRQLSLQ